MTCAGGIAKNITSDCTTQPVGGLEEEVYIFNRTEASITYDPANPSLITGITMDVGAQAYLLTGVKKNLNYGFDRVVADDMADRFSQYLSFKQFEFLAEDVENVDGISDVVAIVERKQKTTTGEGIFEVVGPHSGLYPTTDTLRANDANGTRSLELASQAGEEEPNSQNTIFDTDYATTKAAVLALLTPGVL